MNPKSKLFTIIRLGLGAVVITASLTGCGKGRNHYSAPASAAVTIGALTTPSSSTPPVTTFNQTIAVVDGDGSPFPGQANYWDISSNFSLSDGFNDQFDGALNLTVTTTGISSTGFPYDQTYGELTFYTPTVSTPDGLIVAAITNGVSTNANLNRWMQVRCSCCRCISTERKKSGNAMIAPSLLDITRRMPSSRLRRGCQR